ncbi:MAG: SoxR reducing system RseC family protein [Gammaproteobacteria bacterium]
MITEAGRVLALEGDHAWIACRRQVECARCAEGKGCGGGVLGRLLGDRLHRVRAGTGGLALEVGDQVLIGLQEDAVMRAAVVVYLVPLVLAVIGGLAGYSVSDADLAAAVGAAAGIALGLGWARDFGRRHETDARFQPVVLRRVGNDACEPVT